VAVKKGKKVKSGEAVKVGRWAKLAGVRETRCAGFKTISLLGAILKEAKKATSQKQ